MRVLIAGGGTGGHIYPALAVARSLRARPDGAELALARRPPRPGGESIVPAAGIPLRRLAAALAAHGRAATPTLVARPDPPRRCPSRRPAAILAAGARPRSSRPAATSPSRSSWPPRRCGIPVVLWDGNVIPGRAVRATARLADALAVSFEATCATLAAAAPGRPCYVTGTPIRDTREVDREAARARLGIPDGLRVLLVFGGSQAVRRFNAAVAEALPRLVERVAVIHVTGDDGYAAALADREALPADRRGALPAAPVPARRHADRPRRRRPRRRPGRVIDPGRGHRPRPADRRRAVSARRRPPAGQRPRAGRGRAPPGSSTTRRSTRRRCSTRPPSSTTRPRHLAMSAAARSLGRPAAADAVADLVAGRRAPRARCPDPAAIERRSRGVAA